ncbi:hypothetical protein RhiirA5_415315 [Rhizophagus irregularis]|uniref:Uncharacterized protein n=1 Tax=Rhizophagus irregularis TaxID=588596 RepID=A0A2I1FAJ0_9GLOM|nr:hypothetical protein RhiirA5_415315 [Rhizophagus irregularis]PKY31384.1 hypothetical protein RhiirB3_448962 [Rhizophagus irregularis]CAB5195583.1 unnamed protein product [Rhizophagus irregularis]CAB5390499.1 unnamed protein product [Rhizophagus irregularis]
MKYIFLFIVLICTIHGLTVHASPHHEVRSSLLMKRCTTGGQLGDCGIGGECVTDDDCLPGLYCDTIVGVCYD